MLLSQKKDSLPPTNVRQVTWFEIKAFDLTWLDWRWVNEKLTVWIYEIGWLECTLIECEDSEEELRCELEEKWIAAHYADLAYFTVNVCCKGKLDA